MLKRLDKIRFRGHKRDEFLDLAESPNTSDNECSDDIPVKPRPSLKDAEDYRDPAGPGNLVMASALQDFQRTESDRLNEIKGHLEIALLEKHFLQKNLQYNRLRKSMEQIYMNAAWHGWAIPMFLFLAILRLSLNYLIARGWRIQWSIVPEVSEPVEPPKEDLTVSEKFQLVLDVAQKAQNLFGKMADVLEKIKNLFMWVQPEITQKLYVGLWVAFIASCFLPFKLVGFLMGVYAGIKFFMIDFIFKRCPKLRDKYDTPYIVWTNLPTDPQLKERTNATVSRRLSGHEKVQPVTSSRNILGTNIPSVINREDEGGRSHSTKKCSFHEIFNLSETERPLAAYENGWRCCLINRDRKMPTDYIRNGILYVTENYLCFESSKSGSSKKNKVIKLTDITDIQKYKVLSVLPGSGMGISIATPSTQKPLVFGAMIHRDEAFEMIFTQYMKIMSAASISET
ncbi:GRAM4 protein, partial [Polyodon spathula]|nr:GRAM4 protein [Polyodon spathula]